MTPFIDVAQRKFNPSSTDQIRLTCNTRAEAGRNEVPRTPGKRQESTRALGDSLVHVTLCSTGNSLRHVRAISLRGILLKGTQTSGSWTPHDTCSYRYYAQTMWLWLVSRVCLSPRVKNVTRGTYPVRSLALHPTCVLVCKPFEERYF